MHFRDSTFGRIVLKTKVVVSGGVNTHSDASVNAFVYTQSQVNIATVSPINVNGHLDPVNINAHAHVDPITKDGQASGPVEVKHSSRCVMM